MLNAVTLMNEYCPDSKRSFINCMFCGFPIGSAFGGFFAAWMIPHFAGAACWFWAARCRCCWLC